MSECTHNCSSCGESCGERTSPQDLRKPANALSSIKKVIAVVSGKGGVGKSAVTCTLAAAMAAGKKGGHPGRGHHRPLGAPRLWHSPPGGGQ